MLVEAAAAGIKPDEFWELTPYETMIAIRGLGRRLKYEQLILAQTIGPLLSAWGKGNPGKKLVDAARRALEEE